LALDKLPFGWFDVVFAALLVFGMYRGRKNGLTKELAPTFRWVGIVLVAGLGYKYAGQIFHNFTGLDQAGSDSLGYVALALLVFMIVLPVEGFMNTRLEGSSLFGGAEYYLGISAGLVKYLCILIAGLALMSAPHYTTAEIQMAKISANQTFGGGMEGYSGDFFPTFQEVQESVLKKSQVGPFISDHLAIILIGSPPASPQNTVAKNR